MSQQGLTRIRDYLRTNPGLHRAADIAAGTGLSEGTVAKDMPALLKYEPGVIKPMRGVFCWQPPIATTNGHGQPVLIPADELRHQREMRADAEIASRLSDIATGAWQGPTGDGERDLRELRAEHERDAVPGEDFDGFVDRWGPPFPVKIHGRFRSRYGNWTYRFHTADGREGVINWDDQE